MAFVNLKDRKSGEDLISALDKAAREMKLELRKVKSESPAEHILCGSMDIVKPYRFPFTSFIIYTKTFARLENISDKEVYSTFWIEVLSTEEAESNRFLELAGKYLGTALSPNKTIC